MEAKHTKRHSIKILYDTFRPYRFQVGILVILGIVGAALDGIGINAVIPLLTFLLGKGSLPTDAISVAIQNVFAFVHVPYSFRYLLIFIAIVFTTRSITLAFFAYIRGHIGANYLASEVEELFKATVHVSWPYMIRQKAGHVQNSIFWDAKSNMRLLDASTQFIQSATGSLMYLIIAVNISPGITLVTLFAGGIILLLFRPLIAKTRSYGDETSATEKLLAQHIGEHIQGFKVVKASGVADRVVAHGQRYVERMRDALARAVLVQRVASISIQPLSFLFIIGVFAFSYYSGSFNFAAFAATLYLIQKIFVYFEATQTNIHSIMRLVPYAESVERFKRELEANKEEAEVGTRPFSFERSIEYDDVSLSYEGRTGPALSNVSCSIERGKMLALIGPSGGGKTSFVDLLLRLFHPTNGAIRVDGVPLGDVSLSDWRQHIAYVAQDAFILNASVADNIRFYDGSISLEDIERAARAAHVYDEIMALPEGFNTVIGDRGAELSTGQRQRVALARALARQPAVLVLDEVTSSLDSELEAEIKRVIDELRGKVTLIVIAHRVSTILSADDIVVLKNGVVTERGTPSAMLDRPDSYLSRILLLQGSGA